jgi:H+/Cl- antiporter ClcA
LECRKARHIYSIFTHCHIGVSQGVVAYFTAITSTAFIEVWSNALIGQHLTENLSITSQLPFFVSLFLLIQTAFACMASIFVWIEPVAAGSGIPEVKCFLNGVDLPRVGDPLTLVCKVLGVICSVSAGLPVGKEGPMVHSGAVVAATISSTRTRNDRERRDFVACGTAAGVCTAL